MLFRRLFLPLLVLPRTLLLAAAEAAVLAHVGGVPLACVSCRVNKKAGVLPDVCYVFEISPSTKESFDAVVTT